MTFSEDNLCRHALEFVTAQPRLRVLFDDIRN